MPLRKHAAFGLILALLPLQPAHAEWQETKEGGWKAAYSCDARQDTCVAITCEFGETSRFGIWSKQFSAVPPEAMRQERRFDVDIDGSASSFAVEDGEYLFDKRVIFWPMERQLLRDIEGGTTLSLSRWGEPRIDLRDDQGSLGRTLEGCRVVDRARVRAGSGAASPDAVNPDAVTSAAVTSAETGSAGRGSGWGSMTDGAGRLSLLKEIMPKDAACERSGEGVSCRLGEQAGSDLNSVLAQFDGGSSEMMIRAEIAHSIGDHEGYRTRLYDVLAGLGIPQSFADRCLVQGAVTLDVDRYSVRCDSYTPPSSTIATFHIARR